LQDIEIENLKREKKNIIKTLKRDPKVYLNLVDDISEKKLGSLVNKIVEKLEKRKNILISNFNKDPEATWKKRKNKFTINVSGQLPVTNINLFYKKKTPDWVYIDENYNNKYDTNEIKYFREKNNISIDANLYANRINRSKSLNFTSNTILNSKTKFDFISENGSAPFKIEAENK